ncbi:MAG: PQQ-binding-like beta-propeller repeat protein [Actinomycetota bacterium]
MRLIPRSQKAIAWTISGVFLAIALVLVAYTVVTGGLDDGDQLGTAEGFEQAQRPTGALGTNRWPEYGYDAQRTRANPDLDLPPPYRQAWKQDLGSLLEFPPVVNDGRLFVGTNKRRAYALDVDTGKILWWRKLTGRSAASPAIAGDLVLYTTINGYVEAMHQDDSQIAWRRDVGTSTESSPLIIGDRAYVGTLGGLVLCMDVRTGKLIWTARATGEVKSSLAQSGRQVIVGDYGGRITSFSAKTGRIRWRTTSPGRLLAGAGTFYGNPAVAYGRIYASNVNRRIISLNSRDGSIAWVRVVGDWAYSSPAVNDETVYVGSYDKKLYALDAVTGGVRWTFEAGERIAGSATVIGDLVWFSTIARRPRDGRTFALDARTGERVFTFPDGRYTPATGVDGMLLLTGVRTVYGMKPTG